MPHYVHELVLLKLKKKHGNESIANFGRSELSRARRFRLSRCVSSLSCSLGPLNSLFRDDLVTFRPSTNFCPESILR